MFPKTRELCNVAAVRRTRPDSQGVAVKAQLSSSSILLPHNFGGISIISFVDKRETMSEKLSEYMDKAQ